MAEEASEPTGDPKAALQQVFNLLKARDDTSRFVGLSLLRSSLDANEELRNDESVISRCWSAVPNKFLVRLMKGGGGTDETRNMNNLAVAVLHTFANLLSTEKVAEKKMLDLCEPLVQVTSNLDAAPQMLAFQTLQCMVNSSAGSDVFSTVVDGVEELCSVAMTDGHRFREFLMLYSIAISCTSKQDVQRRLQRYMSKVMARAEMTDPVLVLETVASMGSQLNFFEERQLNTFITTLIQKTISSRPTAKVRNAAVKLASELLLRSSTSGSLATELFSGKHLSKERKEEEKPFAFIFMQYVLIDIRSTIPSLMSTLASPSYQTDSLRLAACYDVLAAFVMYLIRSMDDDEDITKASAPSPMSPDLLLKLRRDLSETFSLTLEFYRDRWDAVISGASGLDPLARTDPKAPAMLTWDNPLIAPEQDPIILSGLRALSLWIREDDNPQLNEQTMGIADMLATLYELSMKEETKTDFRHPILVLLEGILSNSDEAVQLLLDHNGWSILATDLEQCSRPLRRPQTSSTVSPSTRDLIRVLLAIVLSDAMPQTREVWMDVVKWAAEVDGGNLDIGHTGASVVLEVLAELYQLIDAIVSKAPHRLQRKYGSEISKIASTALMFVTRLEGQGMDEGLIDSFTEVAASLVS